MIFGVPKEFFPRHQEERRVGLSPAGVKELVTLGAQVYVETRAGEWAGFTDEDYRAAGAQIVYTREEVYKRSDVVVKVARPLPDEYELFRPGQTILAFFHMAVAPQALLEVLVEKKITAIGYEIIQEENGELTVLKPMSQIAGAMAVQIAGRLLESGEKGGRGVLLSGIPGIPPAEVVILGAGNLGQAAARAFAGIGASVYVLDKNLRKLEEVERVLRGRVVTAIPSRHTLEKMVAFADVLVTAVLVPGARAPILVTEEMVKSMKRGAVIIDFSIDQGGAVETSRLTPSYDFVYLKHDVVHFCVPNVPAYVPRTSSHALTNALMPYLDCVARCSLEESLRTMSALRRGLYTHKGFIVNPYIRVEGLPYHPVDKLLEA